MEARGEEQLIELGLIQQKISTYLEANLTLVPAALEQAQRLLHQLRVFDDDDDDAHDEEAGHGMAPDEVRRMVERANQKNPANRCAAHQPLGCSSSASWRGNP